MRCFQQLFPNESVGGHDHRCYQIPGDCRCCRRCGRRRVCSGRRECAPAIQLPAAPSFADLPAQPKGPVYIVTATSLQLISVFLDQSAKSQDRRLLASRPSQRRIPTASSVSSLPRGQPSFARMRRFPGASSSTSAWVAIPWESVRTGRSAPVLAKGGPC